jgi:hypothetical protein
MDRLTLLVREAGQNSWDAKADTATTVSFAADLYEATDAQKRLLRDVVLHQIPGGLRLRETLSRSRASALRLLAISDRGTHGMGGPTRADVVGHSSESRDFVDFLRNVGEPPSHVAGGTYGYGKAAFYLASRPRTILVHTRCQFGNATQSRFMAAALGESYIGHGVRYTGRHWWGTVIDNIVEPVVGPEADDLGLALGFPAFGGSELGTTVAVLDPDIEERSPATAMEHVAEAVLWHFWPKMLPSQDGHPAMRFRVSFDGNDVPMPDPRATPPLNGFSEAMDIVRGRPVTRPVALETAEYSIASQRPAAELGSLALVKFGHEPRPRLTADNQDSAWVIPDVAHHVALMRGPELVVKYLEGPTLPGATVEYAGVFVVDPSVEEAFAKSEPPTHDDWSPNNLEDPWERRYVRIAQRRLVEVLQEYAVPRPVEPEPGAGGRLGGFSDELGQIFLGEAGTSLTVPSDGDRQRPRPPSGGRRPSPSLRILEDGRLELLDGRRALRVDFTVVAIPGTVRSIVIASPSVILEGHQVETDPPAGVARPEVICWVGPDGRRHTGDRVIIPASDTGQWKTYVSVPADAAVAVQLDAVSGGTG